MTIYRNALMSASLACMAGLGASAWAQQPDGAQMREANELFRAGRYEMARDRYEDAEASGAESPLLDYNLGLTYYRLDELDRAQVSLEGARRDEQLAPLAAYNLGLVSRAAGRTREAEDWFGTAAATTDSDALRRLARDAIARPRAERRQARASARGVEGQASGTNRLEVSVDAAFGYDDNVNRAPSAEYVDVSQLGDPLVEPAKIATEYVPIHVDAAYTLPRAEPDTATTFQLAYQLDANYYNHGRANDESSQRLEIGSHTVLNERVDRRRAIDSAFYVLRHYQRDFDPDDGIDRVLVGNDTSRRFTYDGVGVDGEFDQSIGRFQLGVNARFERRNYDDVPLVSSYDSDLLFLGASLDYLVDDATTISFGMHAYEREFDERLSRNLNGDKLTTNPTLEYDYQGAELGVRRRIGDLFTLDFGYASLERDDAYAGYRDYTLDRMRFEGTVDIRSRASVTLGVVQREYSYPRAFAFNEPGAGSLDVEDVSGTVRGAYHINDALSVTATILPVDITSTDARAEHDRVQSSIGIAWRR